METRAGAGHLVADVTVVWSCIRQGCQQRIREKCTGSGNTWLVELTRFAYGVDMGIREESRMISRWMKVYEDPYFLFTLLEIYQFSYLIWPLIQTFSQLFHQFYPAFLSFSIKLGSIVAYFYHTYKHLKTLTSFSRHCTCLVKHWSNCWPFNTLDYGNITHWNLCRP